MQINRAGATSWNELTSKYPNLKDDIAKNKNDLVECVRLTCVFNSVYCSLMCPL